MSLPSTAATQINELSKKLFQAWNVGEPLHKQDVVALITDERGAYQAQDLFVSLKEEAISGYKVSLTSKKTQDLFQSTEPLYGTETDNQFLSSPATLYLTDMMDPLCEVELVFTAKRICL